MSVSLSMKTTKNVSVVVLVLLFVIEAKPKVHQVLVRFTHYSSLCNQHEKHPAGCSNEHEKINCTEPSHNAPPKCQRQYQIRNNFQEGGNDVKQNYSNTQGFQLLNDLNCSNQSPFINIQAVVYKSPKLPHLLCPVNKSADCAGMAVGSCRTIDCTTKAKLTNVELCEMEDFNVTLSLWEYCKDSVGSCKGYKLPRKPIKDYWICNGDGNYQCEGPNTFLACYAVAAQITYNCSEGKIFNSIRPYIVKHNIL